MSDMEFEITIEESETGITIINVNGFVDAQTFEIMESKLDELIRERKTKLIVNLTDTEYISSAGAGVFITARTQAEELGGAILLMNPNEAVREVFDILGLSAFFNIIDNVEEGEEFFAHQKS
ncbi:MAG: STAS domain-containing protein [Planctomycetes bacterium]|nr:STAS domain-containing protein [Planctomycetota bacterium]